MKKRLVEILATFFYLGRIPFAPGTWGTLGGVALAYGLSYFGSVIYFVISLLVLGLAIWAASQYEKLNGKHDSKEIVIDEVIGYLVTMFMVPPVWQNFLIGFIVFRAFDILKPWPISWLDREVKGGFGTVIDDVAAGVLALLVMQLVVARLSFFF